MKEKVKKILVATDGSDNSERAIIEAKKYSECFSGEITILTVVESLVARYYGYFEVPKLDKDALEEAGEFVLKEALKLFEGSKGEIHTKIRSGDPAEEILKEAEEGQYDLIIMGSRGAGAFSRVILGSVSNKVLNHAEKDVLIIR